MHNRLATAASCRRTDAELRQDAATTGDSPLATPLKVLFVTTPRRMAEWLMEAFASNWPADVHTVGIVGAARGIARLRQEKFDAVVVTHDDDRLNAFDVVIAAQTAEFEGPVVVIGSRDAEELDDLCYEAGVDAYLSLPRATAFCLKRIISHRIERDTLRRENRRLHEASCKPSEGDRDAVRRLLDDHRQLFDTTGATDETELENSLPEELLKHYAELVRTYVIMGSGSLSSDVDRFTQLLLSARLSFQDVMRLHWNVVDNIVHSLGNRSARHVIDRSNLLVMEILVGLGDDYRRRLLDGEQKPAQSDPPD